MSRWVRVGVSAPSARQLTACAIAGLALLTAAGRPSADARGQAACAVPAGARVVVRTSKVVVYTKRIHLRAAPYAGRGTIACAKRYGHPYLLNQRDSYYDEGFARLKPGSVVASGTVVGSVQQPGCGACDTTTDLLSVRELRYGHVLYHAPRHQTIGSTGEDDTVRAFVLKPNGSSALIYARRSVEQAMYPPRYGPATYALYAETTRGEKLLATSTRLDPKSLRLSPDGGTISWTDAGEPHSARLS